MREDFECFLSVDLNESDMGSIRNALNRVYQQGRADAIKEIEEKMHSVNKGTSQKWECMVFDLIVEEMKENNEN